MRYWYVTLVLIILVLGMPFAQAAEGSEMWSARVSPDFAFNGDNITIDVSGIRYEYAQIIIELGGVYVTDFMLRLDPNGIGNATWEIPITTPSGDYTARVVSNGVNVTTVKFQVIFDKVTYLAWQVEKLQVRVEQQNKMLINYGGEVARVKELQQQYWIIATACCSIAICFALFVIWTHRDWLRWSIETFEGKGKVRRLFKAVLHMPPSGYAGTYIDGIDAERAKHAEEKQIMEGELPEKMVIVTTRGDVVTHSREISEVEEVPDVEAARDIMTKHEVKEPFFVRLRKRMTARRERKHAEDLIEDEPAADVVPKVVKRVAKVPEPIPEAVVEPEPAKVEVELPTPRKRTTKVRSTTRGKRAEQVGK
jgi:hypothetical protein